MAPEDFFFIRKSTLEYAEDNVYTENAAPFLKDERFLRAYALGEQTGSWHGGTIRWRAYVACWVAEQVARIPGDFIECGVNRGGLARTMTDYVGFGQLDKCFYLVDTFSGLVPEYLSATEQQKQFLERYAYYKNNSKDYVTRTFASMPNVKVVQGRVPDVLPTIPAEEVAYLSLDMNCTMPEIKAAEFYWDRLTPGGIILLDDYAQKLHSEQQLAFDGFASQRGVSVLSLPTGQGIILKPPLKMLGGALL